MLNSNNKGSSFQDCLALGFSLSLIFGAVINNLGIGFIMGISLSLLLSKGYFQRH
ncbi:hypothetical protein H171_0603 [[Clostridium] celerecrescens 18A]|uniref:Uncharacterized protein n=1 Tax=[Clostridium] celerecrescens 18A TaxID=1286362 RepID=A0A2M8Z139_9FIRM|nr:hypothetical protein H171_0603 [[Clostridium] celerecrescens 18A]